MEIAQFCIGLLQTVIMVWALRVAIKSRPESREGAPAVRFPLVWPLAAMALLAAAAWIPYFLRVGEPQRVISKQAWGTMQDGCYVVMDGSKLQSYSDKYNLFIACGITDPTTDVNQDTTITISSPFTITDNSIAIKAKFTPELLERGKSAQQPATVWQQPFLFPKKGDMSRVKKLSDIREFGGKIVNNCEPIE